MSRCEDKYDLALVETLKNKKIRHQPWYKERLHVKEVKSLKGKTSNNLNGRSWMFVKDGLDDFRSGLPLIPKGGSLIKPEKGVQPNVAHIHRVPKQCVKSNLSHYQVVYSKKLPRKEKQLNEIDYMLQQLQEHPLALHSHLEESVPPELFEELVDCLEPSLNIERITKPDDDAETLTELYDNAEDVFSSERSDSPRQPIIENQAEPSTMPFLEEQFVEMNKLIAHKREMESILYSKKSLYVARLFWQSYTIPAGICAKYRWAVKGESAINNRDGTLAQAENAHIKNVTVSFCEWVASLGGESNNIDESTVAQLFSSGYESKPPLTAPIHVVELTNVPHELRVNSAVTRATSATSKASLKSGHFQPVHIQKKPQKKVRYGSWYLDPSTWQKLVPGEELKDPKDLVEELSEAKMRSLCLDKDLSQRHGARAFIQFMQKRGDEVPEFLSQVAKIQKEEDDKLAAEAASKADLKSGVTTKSKIF